MVLRPLGEKAARGDVEPLYRELALVREDNQTSQLQKFFSEKYERVETPRPDMMLALRVPCLVEKALIFLFAEQNLLPEAHLHELVERLDLDKQYLARRLEDNRRPVEMK